MPARLAFAYFVDTDFSFVFGPAIGVRVAVPHTCAATAEFVALGAAGAAIVAVGFGVDARAAAACFAGVAVAVVAAHTLTSAADSSAGT